MITVYYGRAEKLIAKIGFEKCLNNLEERRKEKVLRTGDQISQVRSLATGELLHLAASRYLGVFSNRTEMVFETEVQPGGKPYLKEYPQIHFNLSHSGDYVCCAIGDVPVGVDIQKHVSVKAGLAKRFFTEAENRMLDGLDAQEREMLFFRMWSIKESYIKFTGQGMKQGIDTFEIDWNSGSIFHKEDVRLSCEIPGEGALKTQESEGVIPDYVQAYFEEFGGIDGYSLSVCRESLETKIVWCNIEEV
ncbi:MAG: 4'-phosphopantetheinyl transferase superfamily protein [Lachnospiraceae bacterium]|nr:4'-phosphopantetheinyl transferase superfamily protein [Lachnospiraceae bacterium]